MNKSKGLLKKIIITKKKNYKKTLFVSLSTMVFIGGFGVGIGLPIAQAHKKTNEIKSTKIHIANDKNLFKNFDQIIGNNILPIRNGKISPEKLVQLANHKNLPKQIKSIKREYKITTNKETGEAKVIVLIKGNHGHQDQVSYKIRGFKSLGDIAIANDLNHFKNFDQTLINKHHLINKDSISVQELESLNGHTQIPSLTDKVTREFSLVVNDNGQGTVNITFKSPNAKDVIHSYKLNGLKNIQEIQADKLFDDLNSVFSKKTEIVKDAFKSKTATQGLNEFKLNKFKNLANIDLSNIENIDQANIVANVNDDNLNIEINVPNSTKESSITYQLTSFKAHAAALADQLVENISRELGTTSSEVVSSKNNESAVEAATKIIDVESFKDYTNKDLSTIENIEKATLSATANINDIDVTINTPNATTNNNPISYKINGFKTLSDIAIANDLNHFKNFNQTLINKPHLINKDSISVQELESLNGHTQIPSLTDKVTREFSLAVNDNGQGTVNITFKSPNAKDVIHSYKLNGLKNIQEIQADKLFDDLNSVFSKKTEIVKDAFKSKTATQGLNEFKLNKFKNLANIDLSNIENIDQANIVANVNDDNLNIEINVPNSTKESSITYQLTSFKAHAAALADQLVENISRELGTTSSEVVSSKNNESAVEAATKIIDVESFKDYTNKDLSTIENIEKATLSATANINDIDVTINTPNATTNNNPISYKIRGFRKQAQIELDQELSRLKRSFKSSYSQRKIIFIENNEKLKDGHVEPIKLKEVLQKYYSYNPTKWPKLNEFISRKYSIVTDNKGEATVSISLRATKNGEAINGNYSFKIQGLFTSTEYLIFKRGKKTVSFTGRIRNP